MKVDKKYIKNLQGKDFVLYAGLLDVAHNLGLISLKTEIWSHDDNQTIVKATATMKDGKSFDGIGDADRSNVNSGIVKHRIRMAETRAKARALRDACNIEMCTVEELGGDEDKPINTDPLPKQGEKMRWGDNKGKPVSEVTDINDLKKHQQWSKGKDNLKAYNQAIIDRLNVLEPAKG